MIKDAAALLDDARPEDFDVEIHSGDDEIRELDGAYEESSAVERQASQNLAIASRKAVRVMRSKGIPVQDIVNLLGVTPGRVSQLAKQP